MGHTPENYYTVNGLEDLSYLLNQRNSRVFLWNTENNVFVDGLLNMQSVAFAGTSTWNNSASSASGKGQFIAENANNAFAFLEGGVSPLSSQKVRSPLNTTIDWKDSSTLTFTLNMGFYTFTEYDDVSAKVSDVMRGVYPDVYWEGSYITAPLGYKKTVPLLNNAGTLINNIAHADTWTEVFEQKRAPLSDMLGCWGLKIGNWFTSPAIFVMSQASFLISSEQNIYGRPLFAQGNVELISSVIVGHRDIRLWMGLE